MASRQDTSSAPRGGYFQQTQRPLNSLLFVLPGLLFYQIAALRFGHEVVAPRDLHRILGYFGAAAWFLPAMLIVVVLLVQHLAHGYRWRFRPGVLAGMLGESVGWVLPLYSLSYLQARFLAAGASTQPSSRWAWLLQSLGAGIYEEFLFRLVFISLVMLLMVDVFEVRRDVVAVAAVVVGGLLFSAYHLSTAELHGGAVFPWDDFVFRALAGMYLGGLYVGRGYGIAVGTHVIWNLYAFWST